MPLQSGSLQTPVTDSAVAGILDGQVTGMDVLDPTENNEKTSLLEVDDEFDVKLTWQLTGAATPVVGGAWIVSLYSDDMDGVGTMTGLIDGPATIPIIGGISPLTFQHTFKVAPPTPKAGLYKLTATISHSPTGDPARLSEMFGYAEATPVNIFNTVTESNGGGGNGVEPPYTGGGRGGGEPPPTDGGSGGGGRLTPVAGVPRSGSVI
jgi:hypothetical protein